MGNAFKKTAPPLPAGFQLDPKLERLVARWKLTMEEVAHFYHQFRLQDEDASGYIQADEFFLFIKEPRTRFQETMYAVITRNGQQELDFTSWMLCVFGFTFTTDAELLEVIFQHFDDGRTGSLSMTDLHNMLIQLHGDNAIFPRDVVNTLTEVLLRKGRFDFDTFCRATAQYPMIMWPVYRLQDRMRDALFGYELFRDIDQRTLDILTNEDEIKEKQKAIWEKRKEKFFLALCGWPCCKATISEKQIAWEERRALALAALEAEQKKKEEEAAKSLTGGTLKELEEKNDDEEDEEEKRKKREALVDLLEFSSDSSISSFTDIEEDEYQVYDELF